MSLEDDISALNRMTTKQLKRRFAELTDDATAANNRPWLIKRIAWRMQALAHGGLCDRAKAKAEELANDADLRLLPPREREVQARKPGAEVPPKPQPTSDGRLPPPGSHITRRYKGRDLKVLVLAAGFEYEGERYASLSSVAKAITGSHCNGFLFFKLNRSES